MVVIQKTSQVIPKQTKGKVLEIDFEREKQKITDEKMIKEVNLCYIFKVI